MSDENFGINRGLVAATTISSALASQLPGVIFFTGFAPPDFGPLGLITSGLTLALFVWVFARPGKKADLPRRALTCTIIAVVLAIFYVSFMRVVTVPAPTETGIDQRFQIGFGLASFSLTEEGVRVIKAHQGGITPQDIMLEKGAFRDGGPQIIWKAWTIFAAWLVLSSIFLAAYVLWSIGMACLAHVLSTRKSRS